MTWHLALQLMQLPTTKRLIEPLKSLATTGRNQSP